MANIMVVDDAVDLAVLCKTYLEMENHDVVMFTEPEKAWDSLQGAAALPDLIMLDVMMPVLDGYTFCSRLLEDPRLREVPVIILTAKAQTKETFKLLTNVSAFLAKPYNQVVMMHMVDKALKPKEG